MSIWKDLKNISKKGKLYVAKNMLIDGKSEEKIKKYTGVTDKDIEKIKKIIEAQGEH
ncbi:hypothetical protein CLHOM_14690 [Clostridium homopropionicum DSM 5847]|uniref:Uncharacterized protein n=1 Tax=Clostridium homopropionicum DSM 5847 TaxID=1121318 RepID=A0A0L6ZAU8_9CLOT|nr:hypothetical protein [Clostridium homopropionicum]KOA20099.1 hypothetical protein CLHOM_14690 [Clostridium homopropionicum DSM 5847]SFG98689.1 hypothetical protein SAMN04488501_1312 [Clostridium homopropionicum]